MKNRSSLNNLLNRDRKTLYIILSIVIVLVLTLTVVYAALSTTLQINGTAEVTAATWDIHFDNIQINPGSVTATTPPKISESKTVNFGVTLTKPGDYYKFSVDVVNDGSIDAMIDSVVKTPELTTEQVKYIKYEIEYNDGNSISSRNLLPKDETKTISVLVSYRSDITASDLPTTATTLDLSFTMVYTQADETGTIVPEGAEIKVVSGDFDTVGSEIAIGDEHFYVISSNSISVTMLAKYNLYIGNHCTSSSECTAYGDEATGIQDPTMIGYPTDGSYPRYGTTAFGTSTNYSGSIVEEYVNNYKTYLENEGIIIEEARLITKEELLFLGCSINNYSCTSSSYAWTYSTSYWMGVAYDSNCVWDVFSNGYFDNRYYADNFRFGVRPVIKILKSEF